MENEAYASCRGDQLNVGRNIFLIFVSSSTSNLVKDFCFVLTRVTHYPSCDKSLAEF